MTPPGGEGSRPRNPNAQLNATWAVAIAFLTNIGLKVLGAIVVWIVGRWLIGVAVRPMSRALATEKVDATIVRYLGSTVTGVLTVVLLVAILGVFGVETTSFAALAAAGGREAFGNAGLPAPEQVHVVRQG